jgi:hypothetical protein
MNHTAWWVGMFATAVALWQECGENPALFCYRIGWVPFAGGKSSARRCRKSSFKAETLEGN